VQEGANVTATDINLPLLSDLPDADTFKLDSTNKRELQSATKEIVPDVLVNCAVLFITEPLWMHQMMNFLLPWTSMYNLVSYNPGSGT
jgi:hypothetical protein